MHQDNEVSWVYAPHPDVTLERGARGLPQIWVFYSKIFFSETARHIQTKLATRHQDHALTLGCAPHGRISPGKGATCPPSLNPTFSLNHLLHNYLSDTDKI